MSLPDPPQTNRAPSAAERPWSWRLEDAASTEVVLTGELGDQRFPSQADAESWVGEIWADLVADGVHQVSLLDGDRLVYGPMSLHP